MSYDIQLAGVGLVVLAAAAYVGFRAGRSFWRRTQGCQACARCSVSGEKEARIGFLDVGVLVRQSKATDPLRRPTLPVGLGDQVAASQSNCDESPARLD